MRQESKRSNIKKMRKLRVQMSARRPVSAVRQMLIKCRLWLGCGVSPIGACVSTLVLQMLVLL